MTEKEPKFLLDPLARELNINRRSVLKGGVSLGAVASVGGLLAACGSDDDGTSTEAEGSGSETTETGSMGASGTVRVASNYSDEKTQAALTATLDAFPNSDVTIEVNQVDHNTWEENISTYLQDPADDLIPWFAAFRLGSIAREGYLLDISDVWTNEFDGVLSSGYKQACTWEGKQYAVPLASYSWQVHYRKSIFEENNLSIPDTWDEFLQVCADAEAAGLIPIAMGNSGNWPAMGTFDQINFRLNGYQYHVDLMAGEEAWTDDKTKAVFTEWEKILPYTQPDSNGRDWSDAGVALANGEAAMMIIGNFVSDQFANESLEDLDFFEFPILNDEHGKDTVEAPIDVWSVVAEPENEAAAKELVAYFGSATAQETYLNAAPGNQAANPSVDPSVHNTLAAKSAGIVQNAKNVTQFLNRDTEPAFATEAGKAFADFYSDPTRIDDILVDLQAKAEELI